MVGNVIFVFGVELMCFFCSIYEKVEGMFEGLFYDLIMVVIVIDCVVVFV